jgi:ABC-2 type transport system permease protein
VRNAWLVARHEYLRVVARRGFLLGTLAVPLGIALLIGFAILMEGMGESKLPIGYVDQAGILSANPSTAGLDAAFDARERLEMRAFPDQESALAALEREEIQAVFILPPGYPDSLQTELYYRDSPPSEDAWGDFDAFVRLNLVATLPQAVRERVYDGPQITVRDVASGREFSEQGVINVVLPFIASALFFITTMFVSGYMLSAVADEKENRTMEVMITSVTPRQLIGGKTAGLLAAALTQLLAYGLATVVGLIVAAPYVPELQHIVVPWTYLGVMALFFLPTFGLLAALMVALGAAVGELQQGQQVAGLLSLIFMLPVFLLGVLFENPGSPIVLLMTLFPTSAFLTVSLRWGLGSIPLWQLGLSWGLLIAATLTAVWIAARVFRAGMLRYGQPLSIKSVMAALRSA